MLGRINKTILFEILMLLPLCVSSQTPNTNTAAKYTNLKISYDQFESIQKLVNEKASIGNQVSGISYHTNLKNLYGKGTLEISFKKSDSPTGYEYRALKTDMLASALQSNMNAVGEKGYRLLQQTPIPIESGFFHTRDLFITIMEKPLLSMTRYQYMVLEYRNIYLERDRIKLAQLDGFTKIRNLQFGRITYVVLEKAY